MSQRIHISLRDDIYNEIEELVKENQVSRSEMVETLLSLAIPIYKNEGRKQDGNSNY